jgi:hypothetical protein
MSDKSTGSSSTGPATNLLNKLGNTLKGKNPIDDIAVNSAKPAQPAKAEDKPTIDAIKAGNILGTRQNTIGASC